MAPVDLLIGPLIQCMEAATLGMPFEVWKTRMGSNRTEGTLEAFKNIYRKGGPKAFWAGTGPKMIESASKVRRQRTSEKRAKKRRRLWIFFQQPGRFFFASLTRDHAHIVRASFAHRQGMILMYAKEGINETLLAGGMDPTAAGVLAGAGGGIAQVSVMGPCTYLVTGAVNDPTTSVFARVKSTYKRGGVAGFYPGGTAIAFRQATNWASRQGFTEFVRVRFKVAFHGDKDATLTKGQEIGAGIVGGTMACWNHPFEVARIEAQTLGNAGKPVGSMVTVMRNIVRVDGVGGLFRGIVPRIGLGIWQTLFMVTGAKLVKDELKKHGLVSK